VSVGAVSLDHLHVRCLENLLLGGGGRALMEVRRCSKYPESVSLLSCSRVRFR
jgi:hypothetical protein